MVINLVVDSFLQNFTNCREGCDGLIVSLNASLSLDWKAIAFPDFQALKMWMIADALLAESYTI